MRLQSVECVLERFPLSCIHFRRVYQEGPAGQRIGAGRGGQGGRGGRDDHCELGEGPGLSNAASPKGESHVRASEAELFRDVAAVCRQPGTRREVFWREAEAGTVSPRPDARGGSQVVRGLLVHVAEVGKVRVAIDEVDEGQVGKPC